MSTLVVTDLDGTLWGESMEVHDSTLAAISKLRQMKIPILVATGRREISARFGLDKNGLSFPAVLLNGALGIDLSSGHKFHERGFTPSQTQEVIAILQSAGISPCAYTADGRIRHDGAPSTNPRHVRETRMYLTKGLPEPQDTVVGFSMLGMTHEDLAPGVEALATSDAAETIFYKDGLFKGWSLMVQPAGVSKQVGINSYIDHARLRPDKVIAIGDGSNDLEMLASADVAVGCTGGNEKALALADVIVPGPDEGGWAQILELI